MLQAWFRHFNVVVVSLSKRLYPHCSSLYPAVHIALISAQALHCFTGSVWLSWRQLKTLLCFFVFVCQQVCASECILMSVCWCMSLCVCASMCACLCHCGNGSNSYVLLLRCQLKVKSFWSMLSSCKKLLSWFWGDILGLGGGKLCVMLHSVLVRMNAGRYHNWIYSSLMRTSSY